MTTGDNPGGISNYRGVNPDDPIYVGEAEESGDKVQATVGIIISILVVLGIVGALAFFIRRNNSAWSKQNVASLGKDCDSLDYRGLDSHFNHDNMPIVPTHIAGQGAPPIYNPFSSHKTYVDPHTYEVTFFPNLIILYIPTYILDQNSAELNTCFLNVTFLMKIMKTSYISLYNSTI